MRIFYDWELHERGPGMPIQPVSLAMVRDDGAHIYLINEACLATIVRNPWLGMNVVPHLPIKFDNSNIFFWDPEHPDYGRVVSTDAIAAEVLRFVRETAKLDGQKVELWADHGAYDHVTLCQLFGPMNELPAGIPMYTNDIQQELARLERQGIKVQLPPTPEHNHHALADALWAMDAYNAMFSDEPIEAMVVDSIEEAEIVDGEVFKKPAPESSPSTNGLPPTPANVTQVAKVQIAGDGAITDFYGVGN